MKGLLTVAFNLERTPDGTILYTQFLQRLLQVPTDNNAARSQNEQARSRSRSRSRHRTSLYISLANVPVSNISNQVLKFHVNRVYVAVFINVRIIMDLNASTYVTSASVMDCMSSEVHKKDFL